MNSEIFTAKSGLFKVVPAEQLLKTKHRLNLLNKIQSMVSLPQSHHQELIKRLFENYAGFVQQLPATQKGHHGEPGGLLDFSLETASIALLVRRGFMLPIGALPEVVAKKHEMWTYAVLTAGLLKHLGPALNEQSIRLYDEKEQFVKVWEPLRESMMNYVFYDVEFPPKPVASLGNRMNLLFVRSVMPKEGIAWLATDAEIMNLWLATLMGESGNGGIIGQIVERAISGDAQKVSAAPPAVNEGLKGAGEPKGVPETRSEEAHPPSESEQGTEVSAYGLMAGTYEYTPGQGGGQNMTPELSADLGDFFVQWLKKNLAEQKILMNQEDGPIHVVPEGLFLICPDIFQKFVEAFPELEIQVNSVQNRFQKLKLHKKHEGLNTFNYASYHTGKRVIYRGYVIEKVDELLPAGFELPDPNPHLELDFV